MAESSTASESTLSISLSVKTGHTCPRSGSGEPKRRIEAAGRAACPGVGTAYRRMSQAARGRACRPTSLTPGFAQGWRRRAGKGCCCWLRHWVRRLSPSRAGYSCRSYFDGLFRVLVREQWQHSTLARFIIGVALDALPRASHADPIIRRGTRAFVICFLAKAAGHAPKPARIAGAGLLRL